jgi:hypothetical protein
MSEITMDVIALAIAGGTVTTIFVWIYALLRAAGYR